MVGLVVRSNVCTGVWWPRMGKPTGRYRFLLEKKVCRKHAGLPPSAVCVGRRMLLAWASSIS